jgi:hypothetical protein
MAGRLGNLSPVGASLLAKTACQMTTMLLIRRFREQARSYKGFGGVLD